MFTVIMLGNNTCAGKEIGVRVRAVNLMGKSGWSREGNLPKRQL
jgi:hypothetical protein